jgi:hypothetical protein
MDIMSGPIKQEFYVIVFFVEATYMYACLGAIACVKTSFLGQLSQFVQTRWLGVEVPRDIKMVCQMI